MCVFVCVCVCVCVWVGVSSVSINIDRCECDRECDTVSHSSAISVWLSHIFVFLTHPDVVNLTHSLAHILSQFDLIKVYYFSDGYESKTQK